MDTTQRLTKTNRPDKRSETSRANAEKARLTKLEKLAEKKRMIIIESETDSDYDSDDSDDSSKSDDEKVDPQQVIKQRQKNTKRRVGRPTKAEELKQKELIEAITDATARAIKLQELERKATAKAKREAVRKAKADGTYVNKGRGRPFKTNEQVVAPKEQEQKVVEPKEQEEKPSEKTTQSRGAFVFC